MTTPQEPSDWLAVQMAEAARSHDTHISYDAAGAIRGVHLATAEMLAGLVEPGLALLKLDRPPAYGLDGYSHYVDLSGDEPVCRERSACPAMVAGARLSRLPVPCRIEIRGPGSVIPSLHEVAQDSVILSFDHADTYAVRVLSVACLPGAFTVSGHG